MNLIEVDKIKSVLLPQVEQLTQDCRSIVGYRVGLLLGGEVGVMLGSELGSEVGSTLGLEDG